MLAILWVNSLERNEICFEEKSEVADGLWETVCFWLAVEPPILWEFLCFFNRGKEYSTLNAPSQITGLWLLFCNFPA